MLAILSLCVGTEICADTVFGDRVSLMGVIRTCQTLREVKTRCPLSTYRKLFSKLGPPVLPKSFDTTRVIRNNNSEIHVSNFVELLKGETFSQYCKRMTYSTSWGSYCELYVLAHDVLKIPIRIITKETQHVTDMNLTSPATYRITLLYSDTEHYDSLLPTSGARPLLEL